MKYAWIDAQHEFELSRMCSVLDVSVSGYRAWKRGGTPERKRLTDAQMLALIRAVHAEFKGAYGSPRMVRELRLRGFSASKERVERLMRENGIHARHKRRYKVTTDSKHGLPVAPNLLDRNFAPTTPNQVWTSCKYAFQRWSGWRRSRVCLCSHSGRIGYFFRTSWQQGSRVQNGVFKSNQGSIENGRVRWY